jgi:hypothetical protein
MANHSPTLLRSLRHKRRRMRAILVAGIAALIMLGSAPPANAAYYYEFDLAAPVPGFAGSGDAEGSIEYTSLAPRKFTVAASIRDNCPSDGKGMELMIRVEMTNGNFYTEGNVAQDLNNCGNGWVVEFPFQYTAPNAIKQSRAQLWATEDGVPFVKIDESTWKDHPET